MSTKPWPEPSSTSTDWSSPTIGPVDENGGSVIAPANKFWHNDAVASRRTNVKKAREILAAAGYTWDGDGKIHYPG